MNLQAYLEAECNGSGLTALTVLAPGNDPFRCDTPDKRAAGEWLAEHVAGLSQPTIHLRGLHYALLGQTKPNGKPYTNTEADWLWLGNPALKAARWLGLVPFDRITDERNAAPIVRLAERSDPTPMIAVGEVELWLPQDLTPTVDVDGFEGRQPFKLALFGEKSSLEPVLGPLADRYGADLFLPTGELSDTMIHTLAKAGEDDGRKMIVFYVSDCDPAGWQMAVSLSRKLQAFKAATVPGVGVRGSAGRAHARSGPRVWLAIHAVEGEGAAREQVDGSDGRRADGDRRDRDLAARSARGDRPRRDPDGFYDSSLAGE